MSEGERERSNDGSSVQSSVGVWIPAGGGGRGMNGIVAYFEISRLNQSHAAYISLSQ